MHKGMAGVKFPLLT